MIDVPHALNPAGFEPCLTVCELCSAVPFSRMCSPLLLLQDAHRLP
jgi:hypothetical protein